MVIRSLIASLFLLLPNQIFACEGTDEMDALFSDDAEASPAFISFDPPPMSAPFRLELIICDASLGDVNVDALMPLHQHGMNYEPVVSRVGEGRFNVSGMVFHMPGLWKIEVIARRQDADLRYWLDVEL